MILQTATRSPQLKTAWGDYLRPLPWSHIVHLTFHEPVTANQATGAFKTFVSRVEKAIGRRPAYFVIQERGAGGVLHLHGLLGGTECLPTGVLTAAWGRYRRSVIAPYEPSLGGAHYVTKTIEPGVDHYDIDWGDIF